MKTNRVVKNAGWIIGARIVQALLSFVIGMLTARFLGPSNYGLINYAASIVAFFTPLMELGITNIIVHQLIEYNDREGETCFEHPVADLVLDRKKILVGWQEQMNLHRMNDSKRVVISEQSPIDV